MPHHRLAAIVSSLTIATGLLFTSHSEAARPVSIVQPKATAPISRDAISASISQAVAKVKPALVRIHVVSVDYGGGREVKQEGYGSGVIISPQGYVITNHHVAGNAVQISCTLTTKEEINATLVGTDPLADIAVLRLQPAQPRQFPSATFGDSAKLRVGDSVFAMGSPLSFSQSVTMGVVSNTELIIPEIFGDEKMTLDGEDVGSVVRWIGHDAEIFPGNSGGPLVNMQGEIVGINEISIGLSGAIPGNLARSVANQLIASGKVRRSWLGFTVQPLLSTVPVKHGVLIADVEKDSAAQTAGFQPGDILIQLNGQPIDVHYKEELPIFNQAVMNLPIGKQVSAIVLRGTEKLTLHVTPQERQAKTSKIEEIKSWGICALTLHDSAGIKRKTPNKNAVVVTSIRPGGPADSAKPPLIEGDMILTINGKIINNLNEFQSVTDEALAKGGENTALTVMFMRDNESCLTVINFTSPMSQLPAHDIRKAWLPVGFQVLTTDLAKALGLGDRTGVRITQLYDDPSIEKSGLQVGDIVTEIDGTPIQASQPEDTDVLPTMIRQYKVGSTVDLTVIREKDTKKISIQLAQSPKQARELKKYRDENFDFTVRDIAFADRLKEDWTPQETGVIIETVGEGSWAALGRLHPGDLLNMVNEKSITNVDDLATVMSAIAKEQPKSIILRVKRHDQNMFLEIHGSWPHH
ncbi:MAG TPA: PDZ domain-containing protein [Armatimonadota bacterium]|nr:PDZ domain-containing protein [Armatimonadota bacterium]